MAKSSFPCVYCGNHSKVINTRYKKSQDHIWRQRKCLVCDKNFSTTETHLNDIDEVFLLKLLTANRTWDYDQAIKSISKRCKKQPLAIKNIIVSLTKESFITFVDNETISLTASGFAKSGVFNSLGQIKE